MRFWERGTTSTLIFAAVLLLLLLPLLAVLQYRWLTQLSEREQEHLKSNLNATAIHFSQEFDDELTRIYVALSPPPGLVQEEGLTAYATQYSHWQTIAQYPRLVKEILVGRIEKNGELHLHRLMTDSGQFVPSDWPSGLAELRRHL